MTPHEAKAELDAYVAGRQYAEDYACVDLDDATPILTVAALRAISTAIAEAEAERAVLADPAAVHLNMLRGGIAKPSVANIIHLYGEETLRAALPPAPAKRGE
jgi:hypothetical protein